MKLFLPFVLLCLLAIVSCKKADQQSKDKSPTWSEKKNHNVKKYNQENAHHEKHHKIHSHDNQANHKSHEERNQHKEAHGYYEVPKHEAELQKDINANKKEIADRLAKEEQDLHLQDLTHPHSPDNAADKNHKSPHQYQRGHHKTNHHFSHPKAEKQSHQKEEEKLFVEPEPKHQGSKPSHSVLEDSFEALSEEVVHEKPHHSQAKKKDSVKKSNKKGYEKVKEKTKKKDYEKVKNKDDKKKKYQHKEKKEKKH